MGLDYIFLWYNLPTSLLTFFRFSFPFLSLFFLILPWQSRFVWIWFKRYHFTKNTNFNLILDTRCMLSLRLSPQAFTLRFIGTTLISFFIAFCQKMYFFFLFPICFWFLNYRFLLSSFLLSLRVESQKYNRHVHFISFKGFILRFYFPYAALVQF